MAAPGRTLTITITTMARSACGTLAAHGDVTQKREPLTVQDKRSFYDTYSGREWDRLQRDPTPLVNFHIHRSDLGRYILLTKLTRDVRMVHGHPPEPPYRNH